MLVELMVVTVYVGCVALHELAHALMAEWLGLTVLGVVWRWTPIPGVGVRRTQGSPGQNLLIAAAGPAMSLALAWVLWPTALHALALGNLAFAVVSLLPMASSDGARMLRAWENLRSGYQPYTRRG
jgi:Zn-dependent protease